jgi:hypothetical protein
MLAGVHCLLHLLLRERGEGICSGDLVGVTEVLQVAEVIHHQLSNLRVIANTLGILVVSADRHQLDRAGFALLSMVSDDPELTLNDNIRISGKCWPSTQS